MMASQKTRLTLELDAALKARLKAAAASKGMSMREYCLGAIDQKLAADEAGQTHTGLNRHAIERLEELRARIFGEGQLPGDSADLIREAREERSRGQ